LHLAVANDTNFRKWLLAHQPAISGVVLDSRNGLVKLRRFAVLAKRMLDDATTLSRHLGIKLLRPAPAC